MGCDWIESRVEACVLVRPPQFVSLLLAAQRRLSWAWTKQRNAAAAKPDRGTTERNAPQSTSQLPCSTKKRKKKANKEDKKKAKKKHKKQKNERNKERSLAFEDLPAEVATLIFTFVDQPQDLCNLLLVSSKVHVLASANAVWERPYWTYTTAEAHALFEEAGLTSNACSYYELLKLSTYSTYQAKLNLVDSDCGLDRWRGSGWSSTVMDLERSVDATEASALIVDSAGRHYALNGYFNWPGEEDGEMPRNIEDQHSVRARLLLSGDKSRYQGQVAFYGMTITHSAAPALRTSVPGSYDSTHVDCRVGAGEAACWLTPEQKAAIVRFLQEEFDYHGPYEWVVALNTA